MKILLLGYGKEGQAMEKYIKSHEDEFGGGTPYLGIPDTPVEIDIWKDFTKSDLEQRDYSPYDIIFRSPSVPPIDYYHIENSLIKNSSMTKYFMENCPCTVIGVTATKGKGTTCSFIKALLDAHGEDAYLVGNIGEPAINILDNLTEKSVVVYEMSSFQLWDLKIPPHISVIGTIEPDHLNVHKDYEEYLQAKANICRHQTSRDACIYYKDNPDSVKIADEAHRAFKIPYPFSIPDDIKAAIEIPGEHNVLNTIAAIAAVAAYKNISPDEYLKRYKSEIIKGLKSFHGLPHRLEFIREIDGVKFYDDNFSTNTASTKVALTAFPGEKIIPIIGGRDKTDYKDLPELYDILNKPYIKKVILLGESGHEFAARYSESALASRMILADTLENAVKKARENAKPGTIIVMSPAAASFDMFENVYDRGNQYQKIVKNF